MRTILFSLVLGGGLLAASAAHAQDSDLAVEGNGYPLGEGAEFHPTVGAELGFTDNVFFEDDRDDVRMAGILRLIAEAWLASKDPEEYASDDPFTAEAEDVNEPAHQRIQFRVGGHLAYEEWLSAEETVRSQRDVEAELSGKLAVNPQGAIRFDAHDNFRRDTRPTNFESFTDTDRIFNNLGLGLKWQPGGRTLGVGAYWENYIDYFEDPDQRFANRMINTIGLRADWSFFPYSKVFADFTYGFVGGFGESTMGFAKRPAQPIRGGVGVATAITELFTVKANVGWAYASYEGGASYNSPVLGAEVGFRYAPTGRVVVDYAWDKKDSVNADFYSEHAIEGHVDQQLGPVVGSAGGLVAWRTYQGIPMDVGPPTRSDFLVGVKARLQWVLRETFAVVADYRTEVDSTEYRSTFGGDTDDPSYVRTEITAGVRAAF